jgi:hypothetical protein
MCTAVLAGCGSPDAIGPNDRDFLARATDHFSGDRSEVFLRSFFADKPNGSFIDIGCGHFRRNNTTYYLETQLHWTGVAIDGNVDVGPEYREHRSRTAFFMFALSDDLHLKDFLVNHRAPHESQLADTSNDPTYTATLDAIYPYISQHLTTSLHVSPHHVDLISIGINGREYEVLRGAAVTLTTTWPDLIRISEPATSRNPQIQGFLAALGYRLKTEWSKGDSHVQFFALN